MTLYDDDLITRLTHGR